MTAFLIAAAFLAPAKADPAPPSVDGEWVVVAFEKRGETVAEGKDALAAIKDGVLAFSPKKDMPGLSAMKLAFTTASAVTVTEIVPEKGSQPAPPERKGLYVRTKEYLVITIPEDAPLKPGDTEATPLDPAKPDRPNATAFCTVILKRVVVEKR